MYLTKIWENLETKYPQLENFTPPMIMDRLQQMPPRERYMSVGTAAFVIVMIIFLGIQSGSKKVGRLEKSLDTDKKILSQINGIAGQLKNQNSKDRAFMTQIRSKGSGFYLGTFLENQALRYQIIPDEIGTESRQDLTDELEEVSVDVKISKIPFTTMLNYLSDVENSKESLLKIKRIRVKKILNDPVNVELAFKVSTFLKK